MAVLTNISRIGPYLAVFSTEIQGVFDLFDEHGSQTITTAELGTCMRALGQHPTEEELSNIIAEIDADGEARIPTHTRTYACTHARMHNGGAAQKDLSKPRYEWLVRQECTHTHTHAYSQTSRYTHTLTHT